MTETMTCAGSARGAEGAGPWGRAAAALLRALARRIEERSGRLTARRLERGLHRGGKELRAYLRRECPELWEVRAEDAYPSPPRSI